MTKVVQIKGANGSGKSTIAFQLLNTSDDVVYTEYATILRDIGWILIGKYVHGRVTSNGCDKLGTVDAIKNAIIMAVECWPEFHVLFEGMMISTIKSTFYDFLLRLSDTHGIQPVFVIMDATPDGCLRRLSSRGTRKVDLKIDNIVGKCNLVGRHAHGYDQHLVKWFPVENVELDDMLLVFLDLVESGESDMTYNELIKLSDGDVYTMLMDIAHNDPLSFDHIAIDAMDYGRRRRLLGYHLIDSTETIRDKEFGLMQFAPWNAEIIGEHYIRHDIGYRTKTGNELSLLIQIHEYDRHDVPLLTEWEQVAFCDDCRGANGGCPGYAPRFDNIKRKCGKLHIMTTSIDMRWVVKYASHRNPFMLMSYADLLTMTYVRRILRAIEDMGYYTLGVSNCTGKCRTCAVSSKGLLCKRPSMRGFSMEAVGIDCDWLHSELYGEWLPWHYKGYWMLPTYMTRYAGFFASHTNSDISHIGMDLEDVLLNDKSYIAPPKMSIQLPMHIFEVPVGIHQGQLMYVYDLWNKEDGLWTS